MDLSVSVVEEGWVVFRAAGVSVPIVNDSNSSPAGAPISQHVVPHTTILTVRGFTVAVKIIEQVLHWQIMTWRFAAVHSAKAPMNCGTGGVYCASVHGIPTKPGLRLVERKLGGSRNYIYSGQQHTSCSGRSLMYHIYTLPQ